MSSDINNSSSIRRTYSVSEIAEILGVSLRKAYDICENPIYFKVIRIGKSIRIPKESFDKWFDSAGESH